MKRMKKRILSFALAICMVFSTVMTTGVTEVKAATTEQITTTNFVVSYNPITGSIGVRRNQTAIDTGVVIQSATLHYTLGNAAGGKVYYNKDGTVGYENPTLFSTAVMTESADNVFASGAIQVLTAASTHFIAITLQDTNNNIYIIGYNGTHTTGSDTNRIATFATAVNSTDGFANTNSNDEVKMAADAIPEVLSTRTTTNFKIQYMSDQTFTITSTSNDITIFQAALYASTSPGKLLTFAANTGVVRNESEITMNGMANAADNKSASCKYTFNGACCFYFVVRDTNYNTYLISFNAHAEKNANGNDVLLTCAGDGGGGVTTYKDSGFASPFSEAVLRQMHIGATQGQNELTGAGTGTVTYANVDLLNQNITVASTTAENGNIVMTPEADSWVSGYTIKDEYGTELYKAENLTGTTVDGVTKGLPVTIENVPSNAGIHVEVTFSKAESVSTEGSGNISTSTNVFDTARAAGSLKWFQEITTISYKNALTANFNATDVNYMLGNEFGNSVYYGVNRLENPVVTMVSNIAGANNYANATPDNIKNQKQAIKDYQFNFGVTADIIVPGTYKQTVEADYYTASNVCRNHWYHVSGTQFNKVGLTRNITIAKDTLSYSIDKTSYVYGATDIKHTLTPASNGVTGSKANVDASKVTYTYAGTLSAGGAYGPTTTAPTMPGSYTVTATYAGDTYIQAYTGTDLQASFNITKAAGAEATLPSISGVGTDYIELDESSLIDGQEYRISNGTWYTAAQLKVSGNRFTDLTEGTAYTIETRAAETEGTNAGTSKTSGFVFTKLTVSGTVSSSGGTSATGNDLPAIVTLTNADGTSFTVETDADGSYSATILAGNDSNYTYNVSAVGKDGYKAAETQSVTFTTTNNTKDLTMTLTDKGNAKEFVAANLSSSDGTVFTAVTDANLDAIIASKDAWDAITDDGVKAEIDKLLANSEPSNYTDMLKEAENKKAAKEFIENNASTITPTAGAQPITEVTKETLEKILASASDWEDNLTDEVKEQINNRLTTTAGAAKDFGQMIADAKAMVESEKDAFVKTYLTGKDETGADVIYKTADSSNLDQILSGQLPWDDMTPSMQTAVNAALAANGTEPANYPDFIATAKQLAATNATQFIKDNLTLTDGTTVITAASDATYAQILASETNWNALSQSEKDEINKQLQVINPTCTYEGMLAQAKDKVAFEANRTEQIAAAAALHTRGESDEMKDIIDAAQQALADYEYDYSKTLEENQAALAAILTQVAEDMEAQAQVEANEAAAASFAEKYLTSKNGNIYKAVTNSNYAQILSGESDWNKLSAAEKAAVNALLEEAGADPDNYPDMLKAAKAAEKAAADQTAADSFVKKYLTGTDGKIFTAATAANYAQIISGSDAWNQLIQAQQDLVNAALKDAGANPSNYPDMLKSALAVKSQLQTPKTADTARTGAYLLILALGCIVVAFTRKRAVK